MKRRLAAILVGDVVGYCAMMEADEEGTAARVAELGAALQEKVRAHDGRVFKTMGDAVLADFASPLNALRCAVEIRNGLAEVPGKTKVPGKTIQMRFGLHLADVIEAGDDLIGDGVNLAARIQSSAEAGAIEISGGFSSRCGGIRLSRSSRWVRGSLRISPKRSRSIARAANSRRGCFRPPPRRLHRGKRSALIPLRSFR